jgi:hypothetical protein
VSRHLARGAGFVLYQIRARARARIWPPNAVRVPGTIVDMRDIRLDDALSDDEQRVCDRLASWVWTIIVGFDLSIVLALLYSYLTPQPRPAVVSIWTWATLIGGAVSCCALLIWLASQPAFGQAREHIADETSASS